MFFFLFLWHVEDRPPCALSVGSRELERVGELERVRERERERKREREKERERESVLVGSLLASRSPVFLKPCA